MQETIDRQIRDLDRMTVGQLQARYEELFEEPPCSHNRRYLFRRCAWRIQAVAEGGLSERAQRRAKELVDEHGLRVSAPRPAAAKKNARRAASGVPGPGTVLVRVYKGRTLEVTVLDEGFLYEGETYRSLSAVARAITGSRWSGRVFFGLVPRKRRAR